MATQTVEFKRKWDGMLVNCWIKQGDEKRKKLPFTNDFATASLDDAVTYRMIWEATGEAGTELTIEYKVQGTQDFKTVVKEWKMPPKSGAVPGELLTRRDEVSFVPRAS